MNTRNAVSRPASASRRALSLMALLALAGSALAGCGSRDGDDAALSASASPSASSSPTETTGATPAPATSSAGTGGAAATGPALCTAAMLSGTVENIPGGASAGGVARALVLTNTSGERACTMMGYPGVSYLDAAGQQVGAAAARLDNAAAAPVTLEPGQSAAAELRETVAQKYGGCQVQATASLLVYPPEDTTSLTVTYPSTGCLNGDIELLQVGALQAR